MNGSNVRAGSFTGNSLFIPSESKGFVTVNSTLSPGQVGIVRVNGTTGEVTTEKSSPRAEEAARKAYDAAAKELRDAGSPYMTPDIVRRLNSSNQVERVTAFLEASAKAGLDVPKEFVDQIIKNPGEFIKQFAGNAAAGAIPVLGQAYEGLQIFAAGAQSLYHSVQWASSLYTVINSNNPAERLASARDGVGAAKLGAGAIMDLIPADLAIHAGRSFAENVSRSVRNRGQRLEIEGGEVKVKESTGTAEPPNPVTTHPNGVESLPNQLKPNSPTVNPVSPAQINRAGAVLGELGENYSFKNTGEVSSRDGKIKGKIDLQGNESWTIDVNGQSVPAIRENQTFRIKGQGANPDITLNPTTGIARVENATVSNFTGKLKQVNGEVGVEYQSPKNGNTLFIQPSESSVNVRISTDGGKTFGKPRSTEKFELVDIGGQNQGIYFKDKTVASTDPRSQALFNDKYVVYNNQKVQGTYQGVAGDSIVVGQAVEINGKTEQISRLLGGNPEGGNNIIWRPGGDVKYQGTELTVVGGRTVLAGNTTIPGVAERVKVYTAANGEISVTSNTKGSGSTPLLPGTPSALSGKTGVLVAGSIPGREVFVPANDSPLIKVNDSFIKVEGGNVQNAGANPFVTKDVGDYRIIVIPGTGEVKVKGIRNNATSEVSLGPGINPNGVTMSGNTIHLKKFDASHGNEIVIRSDNGKLVVDQPLSASPVVGSQQERPVRENLSTNQKLLTATQSAVEGDIRSFKQKFISNIEAENTGLDPSSVNRYVDNLGIRARLFNEAELAKLPEQLRPKLVPEILTSDTVDVMDSGKIIFKDPQTRRTYVIGQLETADGRAVNANFGVDLGLELKQRKGATNTVETIDQRTQAARETLTQGLVKEAEVTKFVERFPENQRQSVLNVLGYLGTQGGFTQFNEFLEVNPRGDRTRGC